MEAVLNWLWQGGVVAVASFVMLRALERGRASVRYVVCWAALLAVVALPALPSIPWTALPIEALRAPQAEAMISFRDSGWTSTLVLFAAWIAWAGIHLGRLGAAIAAIRRARAQSNPFPSHVEATLSGWRRVGATGRHATLVVSESVSTAAVLGWGAPMIAVSPSLMHILEGDELDRILIHEWAHVQRRDDLVNIAQIMVRTIVGWHPALWWLDRRLHVEREIACDEMTVAITGSPKTYAQSLVKLASLRNATRTMQTAPAVLSSSGLRARIVKIVSAPPSLAPIWAHTIALAIVTCLCLMSMGLGGLKLVEAATVLALPILAPETRSATAHRIVPIALPTSSSEMKTARFLPTIPRVPPHRLAEQVSLPQPGVESERPVERDGDDVLYSAAPAEAGPEPLVVPVLTSVPQLPPVRSEVTAEKARAPWTAAGDAGVAIGRKSTKAGVATAGFFSRFAHRVAGSF